MRGRSPLPPNARTTQQLGAFVNKLFGLSGALIGDSNAAMTMECKQWYE